MEEVQVVSAGGDQADDMVQYVIYSGEGDQPIGLEELRDALTKLTGSQVNLHGKKGALGTEEDDPHAALSADNDLNFRMSAERMVGEVSFVDDNIVENGGRGGSGEEEKLVIDDANAVNSLLKRQVQVEKPQIPSQITIETEYGPITLDTNKLTPGQLDGSEQITVNLLTTDSSGDDSKSVTETRGLKLPPGLLTPKGKNIYPEPDESIQGSDFNSVLQQLTDLCSEQNPLPVQEGKGLLKDTDGLEDFMDLKIPGQDQQKQPGVIEVDKLENFLRNKFGDSAKIQIHPTGVVVQQPPKTASLVKPIICCAAHSELKNQETRRAMLPIPLDVTKCPDCHKECMNRKNLRLHIQRFHVPDFKHQCQTRARVVPPPPEDIITDIPVLVETAENLAELGVEKSAPRAYKCSVCDEQCPSQKEYFSHIDKHDQKHMSCCMCGMKYSKVASLKNHVSVVHGGFEQYQCKYCMLKFEMAANWREHESQHETANEDVIRCLKCDDFVQRAKFKQHMANLHRIVSKQKLDCVFCGSRFKSTEYLVTHTQQFHNFEKNAHLCDLCYKAFPTLNSRDLHIVRMHMDEEIMAAEIEFCWQPKDSFKRQCAKCGNIFTTYAKLKSHFDRHGHNEKNNCLLCGKEFEWIVNLDLHYKKDHSAQQVVQYGIVTPTMNIVSHANGNFELVPKIGRQYCSRMDLVDSEPNEDLDKMMVVSEYSSTETEQPKIVEIPRLKSSSSQIVVRKPKTKIVTPKLISSVSKGVHKIPAPTVEFTEDEYNKVMGKTDFDYTKLLPALEPGDDKSNVKAPRHNDIVIGRPATVINLARVWSRRERGLFYMGNEADKFRRAAATIPKKRVGEKWIEMPLFVDELSGKLVTVEGMAELWRERAQTFLDFLGRGQKIDDFLPLYELGQNLSGGKPHAKEVESSVQRNETSIKFVDADGGEKTDKMPLVSSTKSGRSPKFTEKAKAWARDSDAENAGEIDESMYSKKVMIRHADGTLEEATVEKKSEKKKMPWEKETRKRKPKEPEKSIMPDIISGVKKAKRELKARAQSGQTAPTVKRTVVSARPRGGLVKGRKGKPPGFNPDRDCPFPSKPRLVLTDIREIIGDARKIIVQMEADQSPERKRWKKQTARKSFASRRPSSSFTGSGDQARTRQSRFEKKDKKEDVEEQKRASTRAQKEKPLDEVDGPRKVSRRNQEKEAKRSSEEPQDKGDASSKRTAAKAGEKRSSKTDQSSSPPSKKAKGASIVSPREATLTGKTKPETELKKAKKLDVEPEVKTKPTKKVEEKSKGKPGRKPKEVEEVEKPELIKESERRKPGRPKKEPPKIETKQKETTAPEQEKEVADDPFDFDTNEDRDVLSPEPEMPTLEIEISHHEYMIPSDSPLPSTSSTSDSISRETKRALEFLPDFDLEEASLNTSRKSIKMVLHEDEAKTVKIVGSALSPTKERQNTAEASWDALVGSPTKTPSKNS